MKKLLQLLTLLLLLLLVSCTTPLQYRGDFDQKKANYYSERLQYEEKLQKESIKGITNTLNNVEELCFVLHRRMPIRRQQYQVLSISGKLRRLNTYVATLERMRAKFNDIFLFNLTTSGSPQKILKDQFSLQLEDLTDFFILLREIQARVTYLEKFRQEATLKKDLDEEKLQTFSVNFSKSEERLKKVLFQDLTDKLSNIGKVITKDPSFHFEFSVPSSVNIRLDDEEVLLPTEGKEDLEGDVTDYEFYFSEERENFQEHFLVLKQSTERFRLTSEQLAKAESSSEVAQLSQITAIMEESTQQIETLFDEIMNDLQAMVGQERDVVDKNLWAQTKTESGEEKARNDFAFYQQSIVDLNKLLKSSIRMENPSSESQRTIAKVKNIEKYYQNRSGIYSVGQEFLNQDWQEKIAFDSLVQNLQQQLVTLEETSQQGLSPLWKTCLAHYTQKQLPPPYKMVDGYLKVNNE